MRIAQFGDGTLNASVPSRDGSIGDRLELLRGFEQLGHEWLYLSPPERSPGDPHAAGWDWRGPADLLVIETRRSSFYNSGNLARNPAWQQWRAIADWHAGKFGNAQLVIIDFDMNIRSVFGLGCKGEHWHNVPGAVEASSRVREEAVFLTPCEPTALLSTGGARVLRWFWPYSAEWESDLPVPGRFWELAYAGSDYDRRGKFTKFYAEAAQHGWRVAVTGTWNDRRVGGRKGDIKSLCVPGYKTWCDEQGIIFVNDGKSMPYRAVRENVLGHAQATVQILPQSYERTGYYTVRMAEAAASGCVPFVDRDIHHYEQIVPDDWYRVSSLSELAAKRDMIRNHEREHVMWWRAHLRSLGTGKEQAQRIIDSTM